ncbi:DUF3108 domain-containing protein [Bradyrhizobium retamae]|uniref:DUF3108 domain-containing protein n=1 Tax=Bradyrhizobium retamae TaxID=1300035 RepID=A0A0R3NAZ8_9BRAD|nr:DUF3108 domain-containing protein [Bradyrhizobium retamae]KRR29538.1 hypothetical protein CQ13_16650 [Bradyrhizobium retamae]
MNTQSRRSLDFPFVTARCAVSRQTLSARLGLAIGLCAAWGLLAPQTASAQGRLDAHYEATLAGIPVGKGSWTIEIGDDVFSASAQGGTAGLLKAFAGGTGSGASQGRIVNGALVANAYTATTTTQKKSETIRISLANGGVKEFSIDPAPPVDPGRIPVTDAHRKSVLDPMTGSLLRVPGNGEVLAPDSCRTGAGIFDGRMRYDLKLDYKRMETVKAEKGYHGPALVCAIYFNPVAGYIPDRPVIKYLASERRIEITFVPIAGTRVLVPFRMTIPTPFGLAMLEATSFVTTAMPPRVAKTN